MPDPIKHVVLLMLENHSFDQMMGSLQKIYPDLDGVPAGSPPRVNRSLTGREIPQGPVSERQMHLDPLHEVEAVAEQMANNNGGFVINFERQYKKKAGEEVPYVMGYYPLDFLPALHTLGRNFTVCDHWYSSVPGPTWPNRLFALSGTSSGRVKMPESIWHPELAGFFEQNQDTIFDRLNEKNKTWTIYFYDFPCSLLLAHQRRLENLARYREIKGFFEDVKDEKDFPDFVLIEPKYFGVDQNDDHPPHNTMKTEKLIADVYNAIRSYDDLWNSTLLVIAYDEHGGFYDHVTPPSAPPPDEHRQEYTFDQFGIRVPAILASPWVEARVEQTQFDHTSLLKYLIDKWGLGPLGQRTAAANSIAVALRGKRRDDTVGFIRVPYSDLVPQHPEWEQEEPSAFQTGIHAFAYFLSKQADAAAAAALAKASEGASWLTKAQSALARFFTAMGNWLEQGLQQRRQERIRQTMKVATGVLALAKEKHPLSKRAANP
jgi:phospholipase C